MKRRDTPIKKPVLRWPKSLEKFVGITGLFLGMVVTLPFGYQVIVDVAEKIGRPDAALALAGGIALVAGGISSVVIIGLIKPGLLRTFTQKPHIFSTKSNVHDHIIFGCCLRI